MRPGGNPINDRYRVPKPKGISDVPRYIRELVTTFSDRLLYIFKLVWETKKSLLFIMLFMSVWNGILPVIGSLIAAEILNSLSKVYSGAALAFGAISILLVYQFIYMFLTSAVQRIYTMITSVSGELVSNHVKMKIMEKAKTVDMVSFDSPDFYARLENANREAGMRPLQVMSATFSAFSTVISIISYIVVLIAVNPIAPLLIILVSIPATVVSFIYRKKNVNYMFVRSKNRRQMDYYSGVMVNKDLVKEVRLFGLADTFCGKYQEAFSEYYSGLKKLYHQECLWNVAATVVTNVVYCLLYIFIARRVYAGAIEVGSFALYTGAINAIGTGVGTLISTTASIYEGTLFINNLKSFLEAKPGIAPSVETPAHVARHEGHTVVFENVCFRYPGSRRDVLHNINLTITPGETMVIVGLNGAGKTTLIKLLTRLYDPSSGRITLDGRDIKEYDVDELYAMFGIIFQDFGKYAASAEENIRFGDTARLAGTDEVLDAARHSGAADFIEDLPDKYDTPLMRYFETSGAELSIGQWQKLAIARAFYSDSDILILDEPTASLDPLAEQEIFNEFNDLRKGKTSIFISHRLSSATIADNILVMENGEIIEMGSHPELMGKRGRYYELFSTQAARYLDVKESA